MLDCGLRMGELQKLSWADLDFNEYQGQGAIKIKHSKISHGIRTVPMSPCVRTELAGADQSKPIVYGISLIAHEHATIRAAMGLCKEFVPHSMRHTFCTLLVASGASPWEIKTFAGHASITTSERYVHSLHVAGLGAFNWMIEAQNNGTTSTTPEIHLEWELAIV